MQVLGQLERKKHARPRGPAHAVGVEIGDANDFQFLLPRNNGIGRAGETRRAVAAASLPVAGPFAAAHNA